MLRAPGLVATHGPGPERLARSRGTPGSSRHPDQSPAAEGHRPIGPRRIVPPVYLVLHVMAMVLLHMTMPGPTWLRSPWTFAGAVPVLVGLTLGLSAVRLFKSEGTTIRPFQESRSLVVAGPFRISRNPMYLGMALLLIGLAIGFGTTTPWIAIPSFVFVIDRLIIPHEETALADKFGDDYARYRARVRRWL